VSSPDQLNWPSAPPVAGGASPQPTAAMTAPGTSPQPFGSGLTTPDFAACLAMGLQPLRLVQGYFFGQISGWSAYSAYPLRQYPCACMETGPHSTGWLGKVSDLDSAWVTAHQTALERLLQEAAAIGAHGVVGVRTEMSHPTSETSCEVHLYGTAVALAGAPAVERPWATQLAGHKLAKLVEAGFVPGWLAYTRCTAMMAEGCYMEYYGSGGCGTGYQVQPVRDAHELARSEAIGAARQVAAGGAMYDVQMFVHESERYNATYITCSLLGSVVRRVRQAMPLATPVATLNLGR
jgi:hypothetical protein